MSDLSCAKCFNMTNSSHSFKNLKLKGSANGIGKYLDLLPKSASQV